MIELEIVKPPYEENGKACLEVRFQGKVQKWSSDQPSHLTLEGFDAGNKFVTKSGNWYSVEADRKRAKHESHLSRVYERLHGLLEAVLARKGRGGLAQ